MSNKQCFKVKKKKTTRGIPPAALPVLGGRGYPHWPGLGYPPCERIHTYENITFPHPSDADGNNANYDEISNKRIENFIYISRIPETTTIPDPQWGTLYEINSTRLTSSSASTNLPKSRNIRTSQLQEEAQRPYQRNINTCKWRRTKK